jgi:hypothetical protein
MWKFTCYNGTVWTSGHVFLFEAIESFMYATNLHTMDIKMIENLS